MKTEEAKQMLFDELIKFTNWKYLKSSRCLRYRIGKVIFDFNYYSSKYNSLEDVIDVNFQFSIWSKEFSKERDSHSEIAFFMMEPENGYWFDISTIDKLKNVLVDIENRFSEYVFPVVAEFEKSVDQGIRYLANSKDRELYHVDQFSAFKILESNINGSIQRE